MARARYVDIAIDQIDAEPPSGVSRARPRADRCLAATAMALLSAGMFLSSRTALGQAVDDPLVTDLSSHIIAITSSFVGTGLLLFGSIEETGDVIVVVRGPPTPVVVRRKGNTAGIWLNKRSIEYDNVPGYYAVASNRPLDAIASPSLLARLQIGADNLRFVQRTGRDEVKAQPFREAIIRLKTRQRLYREDIGEVVFLGRKLFRTQVHFPAVVPVGTYRAEVYLIRGGRVIAAQATPLYIDKQGVEQTIYEFAHELPLFYGLTAVILAMLSGWIAGTVFHKV